MKRVAAGAHLATPWPFEPAKRPDDKFEYCLDCSFLVLMNERIHVILLSDKSTCSEFTVTMDEHMTISLSLLFD